MVAKNVFLHMKKEEVIVLFQTVNKYQMEHVSDVRQDSTYPQINAIRMILGALLIMEIDVKDVLKAINSIQKDVAFVKFLIVKF